MMTTVALPAAGPARPSSPVDAPLGPVAVVDKRADSSSSSSASVAAVAAAELEGDENASVNAAGVAEPPRATKKRRRVAFEAADIVEFEPTAFTTSVTSGGIPIGMSLKERSRTRRRLDSFEMERKEHRVERQSYMEEGYLDPQERETILSGAGCEEITLESVEAEVNQIIADRRESNEMDFEFLYGLGGLDEGDEDEDEDEERAPVDDEDEPEDDADESNQEDDAVAAFLSTSTTLESSSDTDNNTDDDAACP